MRLAEQTGAPARLMEEASDGGCIGRQGDAVHPDSVGADVLAGEHGGPGRHTDHVLGMGPFESDSCSG